MSAVSALPSAGSAAGSLTSVLCFRSKPIALTYTPYLQATARFLSIFYCSTCVAPHFTRAAICLGP
jgi:hypothetical protein